MTRSQKTSISTDARQLRMYQGCTVPLADLLIRNVGKTSHHIKNAKHLANGMASIMIEQDDMFLSHDVVSPVTNTPINETLDIIKNRLEDDTEVKLQANLNVDDIKELLKFIVTTTYFSYWGTIYQHKFGTAMESPVSPVIANLFMEWLEQQAILTAPVTYRPIHELHVSPSITSETGGHKR